MKKLIALKIGHRLHSLLVFSVFEEASMVRLEVCDWLALHW